MSEEDTITKALVFAYLDDNHPNLAAELKKKENPVCIIINVYIYIY